MLLANPKQRVSAYDALNHPYFEGMQSTNDQKLYSPCLTKASDRKGKLISFNWVFSSWYFNHLLRSLLFCHIKNAVPSWLSINDLESKVNTQVHLLEQWYCFEGHYLNFQTRIYILLLIWWAARNCTSKYLTIWAMLTSTTPSNRSPVSTQAPHSKIETNTSETAFDTNSLAPLPSKPREVPFD